MVPSPVPATVIITDYTTVPFPTKPAAVTVIVTDYTTVPFPTDLPDTTTTINSSQPTLSGSALSSTMLTTTSSATGIPPLPSGFAKPSHKEPKFDDNVVIAVLVVVGIMGALLLALMLYNIYVCLKGSGCVKCVRLQHQLDKWESGKMKRITPEMVRRREALNAATASRGGFSDVDLEQGVSDDVQEERSATLDRLEGNQPENGRGQEAPNERASSSRGVPSDVDDILFHPGSLGTSTSGPLPPPSTTPTQLPRTCYSPPDISRAYQPPSPTSTASIYSQDNGVTGPRVFADHPISDLTVRPRRDSPVGSQRSADISPRTGGANGLSLNERNLREAQRRCESAGYREALRTINRNSATSEERHRALSVVNFADVSLKRAQAPSQYTDLRDDNDDDGHGASRLRNVRESF
jgi:hypothetical protein